ncbi:hypothetical protein GCM10009832_11400 [Dietzia kunjamensis subsp. schimae]
MATALELFDPCGEQVLVLIPCSADEVVDARSFSHALRVKFMYDNFSGLAIPCPIRRLSEKLDPADVRGGRVSPAFHWHAPISLPTRWHLRDGLRHLVAVVGSNRSLT